MFWPITMLENMKKTNPTIANESRVNAIQLPMLTDC
ncbi:Uncharacterised protein [Vibrio cholerae]|uniref:Uncharacterized protein n=1 Tax=Vibrio cholerae TaxID=666 RepID=A0A655RFJ8_VIBCL|nr:Uncharacterised protein [Vibrio cholerae]CSB08700.1 Uncharacterised protein [Vibrio cholerae]CSB15036.1 Uncharacterised protein [Vibrio cholerae]CSC25686.1 Uncharacterised protein [Vibrio cholerae]CSC93781.1 Uncharacterised protein [Vibrio cholerae]